MKCKNTRSSGKTLGVHRRIQDFF